MKMDFEQYDPPSSLVVEEHRVTRAKFPFIDIHNHQFSMPTMDLGELVKKMDALNMAVMVNLSGRGMGSREHLEKSMANVQKNYPTRFVVFTNVDFRSIHEADWGARSARQL